MKKRSILAMFLSAVMVMTSAALPVFAEDTEVEQSAEYDGIVAPDPNASVEVSAVELDDPPEGYVQNDETEQITISTPDALMYLASYVNEGNSLEGYTVTLENDIAMTNYSWTPIGANSYFRGTFQGTYIESEDRYSAIIDLTYDGNGYGGLFGYASNATIQNLTLLNPNIQGTLSAGIVAYIVGGGTIFNVTVAGGRIVGRSAAAAGIVGYIRNSYANYPTGAEDYPMLTIENCSNSAAITSETGPKAAGIVSHVEFAQLNVKNCSNSGNITTTSDSDTTHSGGIAGYIMRAGNINIVDSYNRGAILGERYGGAQCNIGGIISTAHQATSFYFENTNNFGTVTARINESTGAVANAGGIAGRSNTVLTIKNSRNTGAINAYNHVNMSNAGGMIGLMDNTEKRIIEGCSNNASVTATIYPAEDDPDGEVKAGRAGGVVGSIDKAATLEITDWTDGRALPIYGYANPNANVTIDGETYVPPTSLPDENITENEEGDTSYDVSLASVESTEVSGEMTDDAFYASGTFDEATNTRTITFGGDVTLAFNENNEGYNLKNNLIIDLKGHTLKRSSEGKFEDINITPNGSALYINYQDPLHIGRYTVTIKSSVEESGKIIGADLTESNKPNDSLFNLIGSYTGRGVFVEGAQGNIINLSLENVNIESGQTNGFSCNVDGENSAVYYKSQAFRYNDFEDKPELTITNCTLQGNGLGGDGLDINIDTLAKQFNAEVNIKDSKIYASSDKSVGSTGINVKFADCKITVDNSEIKGGSVERYAGGEGIYANGVTDVVPGAEEIIEIKNGSKIFGGDGENGGNAIFIESYVERVSVDNSTVVGGKGNNNLGGAGIHVRSGELSVQNNSSVKHGEGQSSSPSGCAIELRNDPSVKASISDTELWAPEGFSSVIGRTDKSVPDVTLSGDIKIPEGSAPLAGVNIIPDGNFDVDGEMTDIQVNGEDVPDEHLKHIDNYRVHVKLLEDTDEAMLAAIGDTPSSKKYNIALTGYGLEIYRYMSAELTLAIKNGDELTDSYNILGTDHSVVTDLGEVKDADGNVTGHKYGFNMDGAKKEDDSYYSDQTGSSIVIGQIELTGYGKFTATLPDAVIQTAVKPAESEGDDNIVHTYRLKDGTSGEDPDDGEIRFENVEMENSPVTHTMTVNVTFPNEVKGQIADYTDMHVEISGILLDEPIKVDLGNDKGVESDTTPVVTYTSAGTGDAPAYAQYSFTQELPEGMYTLTFSGGGYRTFRRSVLVDDDKEITVWNNVMDDDGPTFLAGDIIAGNAINIYDLSAVVSYFGESMDVDKAHAYTRYDLNRDGQIDSKDVAMVLVSWGN